MVEGDLTSLSGSHLRFCAAERTVGCSLFSEMGHGARSGYGVSGRFLSQHFMAFFGLGGSFGRYTKAELLFDQYNQSQIKMRRKRIMAYITYICDISHPS